LAEDLGGYEGGKRFVDAAKVERGGWSDDFATGLTGRIEYDDCCSAYIFRGYSPADSASVLRCFG